MKAESLSYGICCTPRSVGQTDADLVPTNCRRIWSTSCQNAESRLHRHKTGSVAKTVLSSEDGREGLNIGGQTWIPYSGGGALRPK